jgi:hypothetical protein
VPTYPLPKHADGRKAQISDGYHSREDYSSGKSKRVHRGADIMYWIPRLAKHRGKVDHPYSTGGYEIPRPSQLGGYDVPVLATETAEVFAVRRIRTGWWVGLHLGGGRCVAYHHLSFVMVAEGYAVGEGTPLGHVGGSPVGYGLLHLHFDYAVNCKRRNAERLDGVFHDPADYLKTCTRHLTLEQAWNGDGRVDS